MTSPAPPQSRSSRSGRSTGSRGSRRPAPPDTGPTDTSPTNAEDTSGAPTGPPIAADRRNLPQAMVAVIAISTAWSVGASAQLLRSGEEGGLVALASGGLAGALAVVSLRSISIRSAARWMCLIGALLMLRFGVLPFDSASGMSLILIWIFATTATFVLSSRVSHWSIEPTSTGVVSAQAVPRLRTVVGRSGRVVVVVASIAAAVSIMVGPLLSGGFGGGARAGRNPFFSAGTENSGLLASDRLDMTQRPRLSDQVVMTVATESPGFWRAQTFDRWDGRMWTLSDPGISIVEDGVMSVSTEDDVSRGGVEVRERFTVEASYASALPISPVALRVDSPEPLVQRPDGSVITTSPFGRGSSYTVTSRKPAWDESTLRAAGDAPQEILDRYAATPTATPRVTELAATITADVTTAYDKVMAIQEWMGANLEYSLDAPLSPTGSDVVDHFLFTARLGWCEQISSSLTVMLRLNGVPARVATGYVAAERDPITGRYIVRERQAHAWTEVWFEGVGWVPFDPTAGIALAAGQTDFSFTDAVAQYGPTAFILIAVVVGFGAAVVRGVRRLVVVIVRRLRRGGSGASATAPTWASTTDERLDALGRRWARERAPAETSTVYAADLAARLGDPHLAEVGAAIDRARYGPAGPDGLGGADGLDDATRRQAEAVLTSAAARDPDTR